MSKDLIQALEEAKAALSRLSGFPCGTYEVRP
jgi:hypothetical protein